MALWVPSRSRLALAHREPNLLVPRKKPSEGVSLHPKFKQFMEAAWVPIVGGRLYDLTGKYNDPIYNPSTVKGDVLSFPYNGRGLEFDNRPDSGGDLTYVVRFNTVPEDLGTYTTICSIRYGTSPNQQVNFYVNGGILVTGVGAYVSVGEISCFVSKGSAPFLVAKSAPNAFTQGLNTAVLVCKDGLNSEIYLNGRNITFYQSGTYSASSTYNAAMHTSLGGLGDVDGRSINGDIESGFILRYAMTEAEAIAASADPYSANSGLIEPANQTPFLVSVPAGGGDIDADFISSASVIYQPSITAGAGTLAADFIASSSAIYQPDVSGTGILEADFIASASQIFDSVLSAGAAGLDSDFISSASTIYDPTLEAAGATITADFISSASEVFEPSLAPGSANVFADLIASGSIIYEPVLSGGAADLAADFISSASQIFDVELSGAGSVDADFIASGSSVFDITLEPGGASIVADFIDSGSVIFEPSLLGGASDIDVDYISSASQIYMPSVIDGTTAFPDGISSITARRLSGFRARLN